eukprot:Clim_evm27s3 gene=Clim_evmTU27s3
MAVMSIPADSNPHDRVLSAWTVPLEPLVHDGESDWQKVNRSSRRSGSGSNDTLQNQEVPRKAKRRRPSAGARAAQKRAAAQQQQQQILTKFKETQQEQCQQQQQERPVHQTQVASPPVGGSPPAGGSPVQAVPQSKGSTYASAAAKPRPASGIPKPARVMHIQTGWRSEDPSPVAKRRGLDPLQAATPCSNLKSVQEEMQTGKKSVEGDGTDADTIKSLPSGSPSSVDKLANVANLSEKKANDLKNLIQTLHKVIYDINRVIEEEANVKLGEEMGELLGTFSDHFSDTAQEMSKSCEVTGDEVGRTLDRDTQTEGCPPHLEEDPIESRRDHGQTDATRTERKIVVEDEVSRPALQPDMRLSWADAVELDQQAHQAATEEVAARQSVPKANAWEIQLNPKATTDNRDGSPARVNNVLPLTHSPREDDERVAEQRKAQQQRKQEKAALLRAQRTAERLQRLRQDSQKVQDVVNERERMRQAKLAELESKQEKADRNREAVIQERIRKAHDEDLKISEIRFINNMEQRVKTAEIEQREAMAQERVQELEENRRAKMQARRARDEAVAERRKTTDCELNEWLENIQQKRHDRQQQAESIRESERALREQNSRSKVEEILKRKLTMEMEKAERLQRELNEKMRAGSERHRLQMELRRAKSITFGNRSMINTPVSNLTADEEAFLTEHDLSPITQQEYMCHVCTMIISAEQMAAHVFGKKHNRALIKRSSMSITEGDGTDIESSVGTPSASNTSVTFDGSFKPPIVSCFGPRGPARTHWSECSSVDEDREVRRVLRGSAFGTRGSSGQNSTSIATGKSSPSISRRSRSGSPAAGRSSSRPHTPKRVGSAAPMSPRSSVVSPFVFDKVSDLSIATFMDTGIWVKQNQKRIRRLRQRIRGRQQAAETCKSTTIEQERAQQTIQTVRASLKRVNNAGTGKNRTELPTDVILAKLRDAVKAVQGINGMDLEKAHCLELAEIVEEQWESLPLEARLFTSHWLLEFLLNATIQPFDAQAKARGQEAARQMAEQLGLKLDQPSGATQNQTKRVAASVLAGNEFGLRVVNLTVSTLGSINSLLGSINSEAFLPVSPELIKTAAGYLDVLSALLGARRSYDVVDGEQNKNRVSPAKAGKNDDNMLAQMDADLIGYSVAMGLFHQVHHIMVQADSILKGKTSNDKDEDKNSQRSAERKAMRALVARTLACIGCTARRLASIQRYLPQNDEEDITKFREVVDQSAGLGIVPMVCSLLFSGQLSSTGTSLRVTNADTPFARETMPLVNAGLRTMVQLRHYVPDTMTSVFTEPTVAYQICHMTSFILDHAKHLLDASVRPILHCTVYLLGIFANMQDHRQQLTRRFCSKRPLASLLAELPVEYFTDYCGMTLLFPTLLSATYFNDDNLRIVSQTISSRTLAEYVAKQIALYSDPDCDTIAMHLKNDGTGDNGSPWPELPREFYNLPQRMPVPVAEWKELERLYAE